MRQVRPIVRSFHARFEREAAAWAKRGGHAVVFGKQVHLYFRVPEEKDDLGRWAALDLRARWRRVTKGIFHGLARARVPVRSIEIARTWCTRDAIHPGPLREIDLDCLACAACCKHNRVELSRRDRRRVGELPVERKGGKIVLALAKNGHCVALRRDNTCRIYEARPDACREFPPASEGCLFAREMELGVVDGDT